MEFNEYQKLSRTTVVYPGKNRSLIYPALKLAGEAGECADKIGKVWRNTGKSSTSVIGPRTREEILKELGDILWYISACASELKTTLDDIAAMNLMKLADRKKRGVIKGEGDNR